MVSELADVTVRVHCWICCPILGRAYIGYAHSKDLVHWSEQQFIPVMKHKSNTVNVWAPELFYDDIMDRFIICWASTVPGRFPDYLEEHNNNHMMYYTTTRDFKRFTSVTGKMTFPKGLKHGTAIEVTRKELDYLLRVGGE